MTTEPILFSLFVTGFLSIVGLIRWHKRRQEEVIPRWAARNDLIIDELRPVPFDLSPFTRSKHGDGQPYFIRVVNYQRQAREGHIIASKPGLDFFNDHVQIIWSDDDPTREPAFEYKYEPEGEGENRRDAAPPASPWQLGNRWLEIFYEEGDIDALEPLLAPDLIFRGPFLSCDSAEAYLESLREDPPRGMSYELLREFHDEGVVCFIYRFRKGAVETDMAQIFECENNRIRRIELIFDATAFS